MSFVLRHTYHEPFPARLYIHETGFNGDEGSTQNYFMDICARLIPFVGAAPPQGLDPFLYGIGVAWRDTDATQMLDFYAFRDIKGAWPGNPSFRSLCFREFEPHTPDHGCADGLIVSALEELHRRRSSDMSNFLATFPNIGALYKP